MAIISNSIPWHAKRCLACGGAATRMSLPQVCLNAFDVSSLRIVAEIIAVAPGYLSKSFAHVDKRGKIDP